MDVCTRALRFDPAEKSFDLRPFQHLSNAAGLSPGNASRACLEVERN